MALVTVITPTTGKPSLDALCASIDSQTAKDGVFHLLLWDDMRHTTRTPESYNGAGRYSLVLPAGFGRNGKAPGSPLRAVGLMAAATPLVTFADDDVRWDAFHLELMLQAMEGHHWATTLRTLWGPDGERLGVDRYEAVGDDPSRTVPYEFCDNSCMMFQRSFGTSAAVIYRETTDYNDDRLMYTFLKGKAGTRGRTGVPSVHQISSPHMTDFHRANCSPD